MNARVVALAVLAALGPVTAVFAQAPAPTGPITIGVLAPSTGPFATYARDIIDGARASTRTRSAASSAGASSSWS